jgi:hypothetical protein
MKKIFTFLRHLYSAVLIRSKNVTLNSPPPEIVTLLPIELVESKLARSIAARFLRGLRPPVWQRVFILFRRYFS